MADVYQWFGEPADLLALRLGVGVLPGRLEPGVMMGLYEGICVKESSVNEMNNPNKKAWNWIFKPIHIIWHDRKIPGDATQNNLGLCMIFFRIGVDLYNLFYNHIIYLEIAYIVGITSCFGRAVLTILHRLHLLTADRRLVRQNMDYMKETVTTWIKPYWV